MTDAVNYTTELNALRVRIDQLEAQARSDEAQRDEQRTSRRGMLRLAGAAAVGGIAAVVTAEPAAADAGHVHMDVAANAATAPTGISVPASSLVYGLGCYETGFGTPASEVGSPAIFGHATGTAFDTGVAGHSTGSNSYGVKGIDTGAGVGGAGVKGESNNGAGVYGGGFSEGAVGLLGAGLGGALRLFSGVLTEPPSRATYFTRGTFDTEGLGNVWFCYEDGTPGKWRKIAGPATAGAFHAITPTRVYDSRAATPIPGLLATGQNRLVTVADGRNSVGAVTTANLVPAGATAVAANVTVTGTVGGFGYLAINPGGNTIEGASTINWFGAGQTIANGVTLTLNTTRQLTVICNGIPGASTHFLIDIAGYYL